MAHPSTPTADWSALKYDVASQSALLHLLDAAAAIDLPASVAASVTAQCGLVSASLARSTWAKYSSGWKAFCEFEAHHDASFSWPLSQGVIRTLVVWCTGVRGLRPITNWAYLFAVRLSASSEVFHLRHLKLTNYSPSSYRVQPTSLGPYLALLPGVWSHFHCYSP